MHQHGRKVSEETRKKQSESLKGRVFSEETLSKMRSSAQKRAEREGASHPLIIYRHDSSGKNNPMYGKHLTDEQKARMVAHKTYYSGEDNPNAKRVLCVESGTVYGCIKDAGEATGTCQSKISSVIHGDRKTAGGFHWQLV